MTTFDTPGPITVAIDVQVGRIRLTASDQTETTVEVAPSDPTRRIDVQAAQETQTSFADGRLAVFGPRGRRRLRSGGSVEVSIALPTGSQVAGHGEVSTWRGTGALAECQVETSVGDIELESTGMLALRTSSGDVRVDRVAGSAKVTTGSGAISLGTVTGPATIKNSNGDTRLGAMSDDVQISAANGWIRLDRCEANVVAKTANGGVRIGSARSGRVVAESGNGSLDIGIAEGTAAWLDLRTGYGQLRNELEVTQRPDSGEATVEVRGRTGYGDITVRRGDPAAQDRAKSASA
jgi:hypothetical protein